MIVWILVLIMSVNNGGGPLLIDNIASTEDCQRLANVLLKANHDQFNRYYSGTQCIAVRKAAP